MAIISQLQFSFSRRVPMVMQTEAAECGLACLSMVANYFGLQNDLATLRSRHQISMKGISLQTLILIASKLSLKARPVQLDLDEIEQLKCPCILHWDMNHFVVLVSATSKHITVHDPACGVRKLSISEFSKHFTGVALELMPTLDFRPRNEKQQISFSSMFGKVTGLKRSLLQILFFSISLEIFGLTSPFFFQIVTDSVVVNNDHNLLLVSGCGFFLLQIFQQLTSAFRSWALLYMSVSLNLQWVSNIFSHLLRLPVSYFEKRHVGDVVSRFGSTTYIQKSLTGSFMEAIVDGAMAVIALGLMAFYSMTLTLFVGIAVCLYAVVRTISYLPLRSATDEQIVHAASQQSHFLETVRGIRSIKLFNRFQERETSWLNLLVRQTNAEIRTQKLSIVYRLFSGLLFGFLSILVVWFSAYMILDHQFSVGMMFAFIAYQRQFTERVVSLIDKIFEFVMLKIYVARLSDIVLSEPESSKESIVEAVTDGDYSIHVDGLKFRYGDDEPYVIDNLSLHVANGESVAIVGESGCGKTTLLKLLLGINVASAGNIRIGKMSIQDLGIHQFRSIVGTVMQDDSLFSGTIAENICFFDPHPNEEWMMECARTSSIHEDIMRMPMRYQTLMGDMGTSISGGQKQRILLARALYRRPKILFLDEATSHLDVKREFEVNDAIRALKITRVMIAHRPETIAMADRVVHLVDGCCV